MSLISDQGDLYFGEEQDKSSCDLIIQFEQWWNHRFILHSSLIKLHSGYFKDLLLATDLPKEEGTDRIIISLPKNDLFNDHSMAIKVFFGLLYHPYATGYCYYIREHFKTYVYKGRIFELAEYFQMKNMIGCLMREFDNKELVIQYPGYTIRAQYNEILDNIFLASKYRCFVRVNIEMRILLLKCDPDYHWMLDFLLKIPLDVQNKVVSVLWRETDFPESEQEEMYKDLSSTLKQRLLYIACKKITKTGLNETFLSSI